MENKFQNINKFEYINYVKGIGMLFVIMGHIGFFFGPIYAFHMPLFFFVSGFLLSNVEKKSVGVFLVSKTKGLIWPYFSVSFFSFLYWAILERRFRPSNVSVVKTLVNIFLPSLGMSFIYNVVMWFLVVLFFSIIFVYLVIKYLKLDYKYGMLLSLVLFYIFSRLNQPKVFELAIVMAGAQFFVFSGFYVRNNFFLKDLRNLLVIRTRFYILSSLFSVIGILLFAKLNNYQVNMMNNHYGNILFCIVSAFCGIIFIFSFSILLSRYFSGLRLINFIGENSLLFMVLHDPIKRIVIVICSKVFNQNQEYIRTHLLTASICLIIIVAIVSIIVLVINKVKLIKRILLGIKVKKAL